MGLRELYQFTVGVKGVILNAHFSAFMGLDKTTVESGCWVEGKPVTTEPIHIEMTD
jgi:hypothetical protein